MRKEEIRELAENIHVMKGFDPKHHQDAKEGPVVSIYIPIHRTEREGRRDEWDRVEFKDLAKKAKDCLARDYADADAGISEKLDYILAHEDLPLWVDASAGLGFLVNATDAYVYNLSFAPDPIVVVADEYYIKPLIRNTEYEMEYKLLLLGTDFFSVLDGDYNGVRYEPLPDDVKNYFAETFAEFDGETTALDYYSLEDHEPPYHSFKSRNDVKKEEAEKFFYYVDKAMNDYIVRDSDVPVILVTIPEHEHAFREICTFKNLLPESIKKDGRTMSGTELRDAARAIMCARKDAAIAELVDKYDYRASKGEASDDVAAIGKALFDKKVGVLFIEEGKGIQGKYDPATGAVTDVKESVVESTIIPVTDDLASEFAHIALHQDAQVLVLPADKMPTAKGIAATDRY